MFRTRSGICHCSVVLLSLLLLTDSELSSNTQKTLLITGRSGEAVNFLAPTSDGLPAGDIKAFTVKGKVTWTDPQGNGDRLVRGQIMRQGSRVFTEEQSSVMLMFSNGSVINMDELSHVEFRLYVQEPYDRKKGMYIGLKEDPSISKCHIFLHGGGIIGSVPPLTEQSIFQIDAPQAKFRSRGGSYYIASGTNYVTGNYLMQLSNFNGKALVDASLESELLMSDGAVANGEYDPNAKSNVYDAPEKTLVIIEADKSLLDLSYEPPEMVAISSFSQFFADGPFIRGSVQQLLQGSRFDYYDDSADLFIGKTW